MKTRIIASDNPAAGKVDIYLRCRDYNGKRFKVMPLEIKELTPQDEAAYSPPNLSIDPEEATELMTSLWNIGIRPSNQEGSNSHIGAMARHIEDLRKVSFKLLKIDL